MKAYYDKKLVISLIKDDLVNTKLVNGLIELGIDASCYYLNLNSIIFHLMGFPSNQRTDTLYEEYFTQIQQQAHFIDVSQSNIPLETPATIIYRWLLYEKAKYHK